MIENLFTGFIIACFGLAALMVVAIIIFGGMEKLSERFPKIGNFLENMYNDEK